MSDEGMSLDGVLEDGKVYMRFSNPAAELIKQRLLSEHGLDRSSGEVALFTSGMNSVYAILNSVFGRWGWGKDCMIVYGDELYGDVPRLIKYFCRFYLGQGLAVPVAAHDPADLERMFKDERMRYKRVLFVCEPCTNPSGHVVDFSVVRGLRKRVRELVVMADTTWTPEFRALDQGADVVVMSLTKHHGAGAAIMGCAIGRKTAAGDEGIVETASEWARLTGSHVSPHDCCKILTRMTEMPERVAKANKVANTVARLLQEHASGGTGEVLFPGLESQPSHALAGEYGMRPTVIRFSKKFASGKKRMEWMKSRPGIRYATSYGSTETRLCPWPKRAKEEGWWWLRLSIGSDAVASEVVSAILG